MAPETPAEPEDRDELLAYLRQAYDEMEMSPPEQALFDAHLLGALSWYVDLADWAAVIDRAAAWTVEHRSRPL